MTLTARDKKAILLGASVLGAILLVRLALAPWVGSWGRARGQIASSRGEVTELRTKMRRLLRLRDRLVETYGQAAAKPLEDLEPTRIAFLEGVQKALSAGGMGYQSIEPQSVRLVRDLPGIALVQFQVRSSCKLPQLAKSLAEMRKAKKLIIVDRLVVSGRPKKPGELEVTLVLATLARQEKPW